MLDLIIYVIIRLLDIPLFFETLLFITGLVSALIIFKMFKFMFAD